MRVFILLCVVAFTGSSCVSNEAMNSEIRETVLKPGETIEFQNPNGSGKIEYISDRKRYFSFSEGTERVVKMKVRKKRFRGKLGLYDPASRWFFESSKGKRIVATEAEMNFESLEEALEYLHQGSAIQKWVYNDEGYVVGYFESPERDQINIDLYRYYINGKPALNMPGYDNSKVVLMADS